MGTFQKKATYIFRKNIPKTKKIIITQWQSFMGNSKAAAKSLVHLTDLFVVLDIKIRKFLLH